MHHNKQFMRELKKEAQIAFEKAYPELVFREVFGKNYLNEEDRQQSPKETDGFIETGNILEETDWLKEVL